MCRLTNISWDSLTLLAPAAHLLKSNINIPPELKRKAWIELYYCLEGNPWAQLHSLQNAWDADQTPLQELANELKVLKSQFEHLNTTNLSPLQFAYQRSNLSTLAFLLFFHFRERNLDVVEGMHAWLVQQQHSSTESKARRSLCHTAVFLTRGIARALRNDPAASSDLFRALLNAPSELEQTVVSVLASVKLRLRVHQDALSALEHLATNVSHDNLFPLSGPLETNLKLVETANQNHVFATRLQPVNELKSMISCERGVIRSLSKDEPEQAAYYLLDVSQGDSGFLLWGAYYLLKSAELHQSTNTARSVALASATIQLIAESVLGTFLEGAPVHQLFASQFALALLQLAFSIVKTHPIGTSLLNTQLAELFAQLASQTVSVIPWFPIAHLPLVLAADLVYMRCIGMKVQRKLFLHYLECDPNKQYPGLTPTEVLHATLQGAVKGWLLEDIEFDRHPDDDLTSEGYADGPHSIKKIKSVGENNPADLLSMANLKVKDLQQSPSPPIPLPQSWEEARKFAMAQCLAEKNLKFRHMQQVLEWDYLPRDSEGFLAQNQKLCSGKLPLHSINGFSFDVNTGAFKLNVTPADRTNPGLFSWNDVREVFSKGVAVSIFSLDAPDTEHPLHPFNKTVFLPSTLAGTDLLATMFHADYILKFLTIGTEVSSQPPFLLRDTTTRNSFFHQLPQHLQYELRPTKNSSHFSHRAHRFWIEPGELSTKRETNSNKVNFLFGTLKMKVKKHLLKETLMVSWLMMRTNPTMVPVMKPDLPKTLPNTMMKLVPTCQYFCGYVNLPKSKRL